MVSLILVRFIAVPLIVAAIVCFVLKGQMKDVASATAAKNYETKGGMKFTIQKDVFTHKTEEREKIERPKEDQKK